MSLNVTSYPQKVVNNNNNTVSKWSAVHHAMIFEMQRQDYQVTLLLNPSDNTQMYVSLNGFAGVISTILTAGDSVYIETANDSATFTVDSVVNPNKFLVTIGTFQGLGDVFGYTNFLNRLNYFTVTNIWGVDAQSQYYLIGQSINKPDASGKVKVDVSSYLKSVVDYVDEFTYDAINKQDLTLGGSYNITFSENWSGFAGPYSAMSNTILRFFVNAAKQIQDELGENMGLYVPFNNYDSADIRAKFLSDFESPTYFPNFPFSLSFVYSDGLAGTVTTREEERFNLNGISQSTSSDELNNAEVQDVNRLMITESYASDIDSIDVWLENDGTVDCIQYMASGYVAIGYVQEICGNPPVSDPVQQNATF